MSEKLENVDSDFNNKLEYAKAVITVYRIPDGCFETEPEKTETDIVYMSESYKKELEKNKQS